VEDTFSGDMLSACKDSQENYPQFDMHQGYFGRSFQAKNLKLAEQYIYKCDNVLSNKFVTFFNFFQKNFPDQIAA
jgi:hypothetical protein